MTKAERALWRVLRLRQVGGLKFRRQHPLGPYILDFVCLEARVVIEVDGGQHVDSAYDVRRDEWLCAQGFRVRRFWNHDVIHRLDAVVEAISRAVPHPSLPPQAGEGA